MSYPDDYNSGAQRQGGGLNMGQGEPTFLPPLHLPFRTLHPSGLYDATHTSLNRR